jgi:hypothetical protein
VLIGGATAVENCESRMLVIPVLLHLAGGSRVSVRGTGGGGVRALRECVTAARARSEWAVWQGARVSLSATPAI